MEKKIRQLLVAIGDDTHIVDKKDGEIVPFSVNGEMALVGWFRQGDQEWNGKYVINIVYEPTTNSNPHAEGTKSPNN